MKEKEQRKYLASLYYDALNYIQFTGNNLFAQFQGNYHYCLKIGIDKSRLDRVWEQAMRDYHNMGL